MPDPSTNICPGCKVKEKAFSRNGKRYCYCQACIDEYRRSYDDRGVDERIHQGRERAKLKEQTNERKFTWFDIPPAEQHDPRPRLAHDNSFKSLFLISDLQHTLTDNEIKR